MEKAAGTALRNRNGGKMKKKTKKKSTAKKAAVKKTAVKKTAVKKIEKSKNLSASAAAKQDIIGLLSMLVQKLTSFESKLDMVLSRISAQPIAAPRPQPLAVNPGIAPVPAKPPRPSRPMFKAVCADCGRSCEVPFKPREDRKVYCKECFSRRRAGGISKMPEPVKTKTEIAVKIPAGKKIKKKPAARRVSAGSGQRRGLADSSAKEGSRRTKKKTVKKKKANKK